MFVADSFAANLGVIDLSKTPNIIFNEQIVKNQSDDYRFTLTENAFVSYSMNTNSVLCVKGCGNPSVSYGIYDVLGKQIDNSGSIVLRSGTYMFGVKSTGMGSNNTVLYNGQINFVSPVPEPADYLLFFIGLICLATAVAHRKRI